MTRQEAIEGDYARRIAAIRDEMEQWIKTPPTNETLHLYGRDLILRARVILGRKSFEYQAPIPALSGNLKLEEKMPSHCAIRMSVAHLTLDTHTSGSVRGWHILEKLPNGSNYPLPDNTIQIIESSALNLHIGKPEEQLQKVISAIDESTDPAEILKKGKVAFTIFPDGQVVDHHLLVDFPPSIALCSLSLLQMEQMAGKKSELVIAAS